MRYTNLGQSDLSVSRICLGCMGFGDAGNGQHSWWYTAPTIVNTFLESYNFTGKTIILFATSGGSGFGKTAADLKNSARGAVIRDGKLLNGRQTKEALAAWVSSLSV